MKTTYETIITQVEQGSHCVVDFKNHTIRLNGKLFDVSDSNHGIKQYNDLDEWLDEVEDLYDEYKYSKPSKQSANQERKAKFKALTASQLVETLGHNALNSPIPRNVAQAKLEVFILLSLVHGIFNPEELFAKDWFYQGADKSFILRKDWF